MKAVVLILFSILVILIIFYPLIENWSSLEQIVYLWLVLSLMVNIYEILIISNRTSLRKNNDFWKKDRDLSQIFSKQFWIDGWAIYASKIDNRYLSYSHLNVFLIEGLNVLISMAPAILLLILIPIKNQSKNKKYHSLNKIIGTVAVIFSFLQLFLTGIYLLSIPQADLQNKSSNQWYLLFDLPWIVFPIITIHYGLSLL